MDGPPGARGGAGGKGGMLNDSPTCYMCFDDEDTEENPLITPCKCRGDTRYVHVSCLRKWHTAEADNQICFLSSVDATCSVCKTTFKSDFRLKDGRTMKLFKSSLEPPYVSLLVATKHEMAQRLFNTRFQLSFSTLMVAIIVLAIVKNAFGGEAYSNWAMLILILVIGAIMTTFLSYTEGVLRILAPYS